MASFLRHFRTVSGLTLASRVLGLARDAALAHVLGAGVFMDAYSQAFQMPNLLRRLFGEGALSAAFIPVFTDYLERGDRRAANRFMGLMIVLLVSVLAAVSLVVVGALLVARHFTADLPKWHLIFGLAAVMFPFAVTICLVALLQAALNCVQHFVAPALAPILLNIFIIGGAVAAAAMLADDPVHQVYLIGATIVLAGIAQVLIQVPALVKKGLALRPAWDLHHPGLRRVLRLMGPMVLAVGVVQVNAFMDSTIANVFSPYAEGAETFTLAGRTIAFPMKMGAAAMLYFGQRLYNFPLGVFAIALATVIFPELSRRAHRGDTAGLGRVASHGLRLTVFIAVPSAVGLMLVCEPLLRLWLEHGRFADRPDAVVRAAWVARAYALGIWAYSANHMLLRAFYASEDTRTPLKVAMAAAVLNFGLNLALIWPLAENGLALATAVSAIGQFVVLGALVSRRLAHVAWPEVLATAGRTVVATAAMAAAVAMAVYGLAPALGATGRALAAWKLGLGLGAGVAVFLAAAWALKMPELRDLLRLRGDDEEDDSQQGGT
ncbi:MAG: murein biosynthesis integral membrane protein MurJ [Phycisphaerae bacterium]